MHVEYAQLPPPEDSADRIFVTDNAVIVLDGATAFAPVSVSAQSYADHLGRAIVEQLVAAPDIDLREGVAAAIRQTVHRLDLSRAASPTSTVSILRATSTAYDVLALGDSPVVWGNSHQHWILSDDRIDQLNLPQRHEYRARLRAGYGFDEQHRTTLRDLQQGQSQHRNVDAGYWIAETEPQAAQNALIAEVPLTDLDWAILLTDGAFDLLDYQGHDWKKIARYSSDQLSEALLHLHEWEEVIDPFGKELPRAKRHDDKAIACIKSGRSYV